MQVEKERMRAIKDGSIVKDDRLEEHLTLAPEPRSPNAASDEASDCRGSGARRSLTLTGGMMRAGDRPPTCSPKTGRGGLLRISPSCRSCCGSLESRSLLRRGDDSYFQKAELRRNFNRRCRASLDLPNCAPTLRPLRSCDEARRIAPNVLSTHTAHIDIALRWHR